MHRKPSPDLCPIYPLYTKFCVTCIHMFVYINSHIHTHTRCTYQCPPFVYVASSMEMEENTSRVAEHGELQAEERQQPERMRHVCVCVCARARARARVCASVRACVSRVIWVEYGDMTPQSKHTHGQRQPERVQYRGRHRRLQYRSYMISETVR